MPAFRSIKSFFDNGYTGKGAGAITAVCVCLLLRSGAVVGPHPEILLPLPAVLITGITVYIKAKRSWGKDSRRSVIGETPGMAHSVIFLPINFKHQKRYIPGRK